MEQRRKSAKFWLVISIVLMVVSMIGAGNVQKSGDVVIKDLRWETESGRLMSAYLLVPASATAENPAPAIVTSHGWYNNREMQDLNYIEYARRGYVVMSIDMYGHGYSDPFTGAGGFAQNGTGMYDAVLLMATLPYVDKSKIGVTGHSNGARAANLSVQEDNSRDEQLISAVLLVANDAYYADPLNSQNWYNMYGSRDVGIIAALYDEFFFRRAKEDGTRTVPRTYMESLDAQSFLHFGTDPRGKDTRTTATFYTENIDGRETIRAIWQPDEIHPWNHFSKESVIYGVSFFDKAFGAPHAIAPDQQVWQWKVFFNTIGLVGFMIFFVSFAVVMLWTPFFASLRAPDVMKPMPAPKGAVMLWFWAALIVAAIVSVAVYVPSLNASVAPHPAAGYPTFLPIRNEAIFPQQTPYAIGMWAFMCGVAAIVLMILYYYIFGKKNGMDLAALGVKISFAKLGKTILLAVLVVAATYMWVFISQYFFMVDYRIWVLTIKAFHLKPLLISLPYLVLFLTFYIANSVSFNVFNYNGIGGRREWVNIFILALFNALPSLLIVLVQYTTFFSTGELFRGYVTNPPVPMMSIGGIWQIPIIVILFVAAIISRKIYRVTGNPYLAGIMNGLLITIYSCTNTLTILPQ